MKTVMKNYSDVEMRNLSKMGVDLFNKSLRIRHEGHKGPNKVYKRKISQDIKYFELNKEVRKDYTS